MRSFLLPVDFSEHSVATYKYAIKIAGTSEKTKLYFHHTFNDQLLNTDPTMDNSFDDSSMLNMELIEEFRKQSLLNMKKLITAVNQHLGSMNISNFEIEYSVEGGDTNWEIINLCNEINADLIIIGTRGVGKKDIFQGSVAKKIMNKASVPVIAVPLGDLDKDAKINIMYACNSSKNNDYIKIQSLFNLFINIQTHVSVVHFHFDGKKDKNEFLIEELEELFSEDIYLHNMSFSIIDVSNKDVIMDQFVKNNDINTISFIAHKSNIFKHLFSDKITKDDFFRLNLPMVALHD